MFSFLFAILMTGCMTNKRMLANAKRDIANHNCLKQVEGKLLVNQCNRIEIYREEIQVVFRCIKPDIKRQNLWDTWWFRMTSSTLQFPPELIVQVEQHTICIDSQIRLEAYPAKEEEQ